MSKFIPHDCWLIIIPYIKDYYDLVNILLITKGLHNYLIKYVENISNVEIKTLNTDKRLNYYNYGINPYSKVKLNKKIRVLVFKINSNIAFDLFSYFREMMCDGKKDKSIDGLKYSCYVNFNNVIGRNCNIKKIKIYSDMVANKKGITFCIPKIKKDGKIVKINDIYYKYFESIKIDGKTKHDILYIKVLSLCILIIHYSKIKQKLDVSIVPKIDFIYNVDKLMHWSNNCVEKYDIERIINIGLGKLSKKLKRFDFKGYDPYINLTGFRYKITRYHEKISKKKREDVEDIIDKFFRQKSVNEHSSLYEIQLLDLLEYNSNVCSKDYKTHMFCLDNKLLQNKNIKLTKYSGDFGDVFSDGYVHDSYGLALHKFIRPKNYIGMKKIDLSSLNFKYNLINIIGIRLYDFLKNLSKKYRIYITGSIIPLLVNGCIFNSDIDIYVEKLYEKQSKIIKKFLNSKLFEVLDIKVSSKFRIIISLKLLCNKRIIKLDMFSTFGYVHTVISKFHIPLVRAMYVLRNEKLYGFMSFVRAIKYNIIYNVFDIGFISIKLKTLADIYYKYYVRGFGCFLNEKDSIYFEKYIKEKELGKY